MDELMALIAARGGAYYVDERCSVTISDVHRTRTVERPYDYSVFVKFFDRHYEVIGTFWTFVQNGAELALLLKNNNLPANVAKWV